MTKVPGVGIVGGGIWAQHHMNAVRDLESEGRARLVAMCARTQATVDKVTSEWGIAGTRDYRELVARPDVDCVIVSTPDHLHRDMTIQALEAGKHVLCEKPMDLTVEGCDAMVEAADRTGKLLFLDFHKRFDPVQQKTRAMIQSGQLGTIQYGYCWMEDKIIVPRDWFAKWADQTTIFWFIGVHQVDMLRWTLGQEVVSVKARGWKGKLTSLGIDTYDSIHAELEFDGGAIFGVDVNWIIPENFPAVVNQGARFVGSEGLLELDTQDRGFGGAWGSGPWQTININSAHVYEDCLGRKNHEGYFINPTKEWLRLVSHLLEGGDLKALEGKYPSGRDGRESTRITVAIHKSLESGKAISL